VVFSHTSNISLDELVIYCVRKILDAGEECTFERLVYECFTRFPANFSLIRYPHWPDSARVNKAWLRCRTDKGWMVGSVKEGFRLTPVGSAAAERVDRQLQRLADGKTDPILAESPGRERYSALLHQVRNHPSFVRYKESGSDFQPSEMELRGLLGATMETPPRVLRQNFSAYKNAASTYQDAEILNFLAICDKSLRELLEIRR